MNEFDHDKFSARVRGKRAELGLTQSELADKAGVSTSAIVNYEKGIGGYTPGLERLVAVSKALGTTLDYLLGFRD